MKKIFVLLISVLLISTITSCSNSNKNTSDTTGSTAGDVISNSENISDVSSDNTETSIDTKDSTDEIDGETEKVEDVEDSEDVIEDTNSETSSPDNEDEKTDGTSDEENTEDATVDVPVETNPNPEDVEDSNQTTTTPDTSTEVEVPAHTHQYVTTVVEATCVKNGYTLHTCECGHTYTDNEISALGHVYTESVVAPTTSAQGYTLYTCHCGHSYKGNYVDKLPVQTNPDEFVSDGWKGEERENGNSGDRTIAGQFYETKDYTRNFYTPGMTKDEVIQAINEYVAPVYTDRLFSHGICMNDFEDGHFARITEKDGKMGVEVFGWRKSYDSDSATNSSLNIVMEMFYFFTKDKDVAYALWNVNDYLGINGSAATTTSVVEGFGFVCSNETPNSIEMSMNGIHIYWEWSTGTGSSMFYFG